MTPRLTIGIPIFNAARYIAPAIRSVLAQGFEDWELLLVDDGSTDGSPDICRSFDDPRIRLLSDGVNRGLVYRLNQMIAIARAPLFARMDADDLMHPDRLARQVACFAADARLQVCGSAAYVMDENNRVYGVRCDNHNGQFAGIRSGFLHPTLMGRTEWFRRYPYDPDYVRAEDLELWQRADAATPCRLITEPLLFYREPLQAHPAKYRVSCRTFRRILRRYGPERLGRIGTSVAIATSFAREVAYQAAGAAGFAENIIRRRNRPCTAGELVQADAILEILSRASEIPAALEQVR